MARLTFKEYLNENFPLETDPLEFVKLNKKGKKDMAAEKLAIANYPSDSTAVPIELSKFTTTKSDTEIAKPIASGGGAKLRALRQIQAREQPTPHIKTNNDFGADAYWRTPLNLQGPQHTMMPSQRK